MLRVAAKITKTEIERVIKAAMDVGLRPSRVEVEGGRIVIHAIDADLTESASPLDEWRRKDGEG